MGTETIKIEKLQDCTQFTSWKFQVRVALAARELFGVVNGTEKKPSEAATEKSQSSKLIADWDRKDAKAQSIIVSALGSKTIVHVINCSSSNEMWQKLISVFEQTTEIGKSQLQQKFFLFSKDPGDDMATHISKMELLTHQMKNMKIAIDDTMVITRLLMTLPQEYRHFVSAWDSTQADMQTLAHLKNRLMVEEGRLNNGVTTSEAFLMKQSSAAKKPNTKFRKKNQKGCFKCGSLEHWKKDCKVSKASHGGRTDPKKGDNETSSVFYSSLDVGTTYDDSFFGDSGATDHLSKNRAWFYNYVELSTPRAITLGNGDIIYAIGKGDIDVLTTNGKTWRKTTLTNSYYAPKLHTNLFSELYVLDKGYEIHSKARELHILDHGNIAAVGVRHASGLFKMLFKIIKPNESIANLTVKKLSLQTWHERLGHQNVAHIREILRSKTVEFVNESFDCAGCAKGKLHRLSFNLRDDRASKCGEIIHSDVCGPFPEVSFGGARYFLLFKDDHSHFRKVYFLKQKSEVFEKFKSYLNWTEKQSGHAVKILRTDNGTEFVNKEMKQFLDKNGIEHQRTVPYTPEQNGCAERENRTIMESAMSMIHAKELNPKLWAEAVNTAVFILNRTGTSTVKCKVPYELWHGKSISISDFRIFGTEVFVHIPKQGRQKLHAKAKKCIFVGYDEHVKGFRVFDAATHKVEIVRDVKFLLEEFPSRKKNSKNENSSTEDENIVSIDVNEISDKDELHPQQEQSTQRRNTRLAHIDENNILEKRLRDRGDQVGTSMTSILMMMFCDEPTTYEAAINSADNSKWIDAMQEEYNSLLANKTWTLVEAPKNQKLIDNKWVYKVKRNPDSSIERFKARLVGRGFTQEYGIDYEETFSPVVRFSSIRILLSIAAQQKFDIEQFDIKTAFLYGELEENVYMKQPIGFDDGTGRVCKLQKSLYGLKQASRCWNIKFTQFIGKFGFKVTESDPCVFVSVKGDDIAILAIYVDDGLIMGNNKNIIESVIFHLKQQFEVKTIGLGCFLGIEMERLKDGSIFVHQTAYAQKLLSKFSMNDCNPVATPADSNQTLSAFEDSKQINYPYRQLVGSLMYLAIATRPDIAYAIGNVSRYLENPKEVHVTAAKRILKYIKGTINYGILYSSNGEKRICGYSDADFAGDVKTRKSTTGYVFLIGSGSVSWCSELQKSISISTMESEYIAASEATRELVWLQRITNELTKDRFKIPSLHMDNQSAIKLTKNPANHKRSKHIDVRYHFIREQIKKKVMNIEDIRTADQVADVFTKALPRNRFEELRSKLGMIDIKVRDA